MNKTEMTVVAALFALLLAWGFMQSKRTPLPVVPATATAPLVSEGGAGAPASTNGVVPFIAAAPAGLAPAPVSPQAASAARRPEKIVSLWSEELVVNLSSHGGAVVDAEINDYRSSVDKDSAHMHLDFSALPSLAYIGIPGLDLGGDFDLFLNESGNEATLSATSPEGVTLTRRIALSENYRLSVEDIFLNAGSNAYTLGQHRITVGPMQMLKTESYVPGYLFLGIDTRPSAEDGKVKHWAKKMSGLFGVKKSMGCAAPSAVGLPLSAEKQIQTPLDWMAAKNKYFVQILAPEGGASDGTLRAYRDGSSTNALVIQSVSGELHFGAAPLNVGASLTHTYSYYVGPKKDKALKSLGGHQREVMQFGWFEWYRGMCRGLLWTLNTIHNFVPNYGIAIILLTILVRLLFWPVLQKSTVHMRRMQKVQPLMTAIREKHKDDPQKMNQAMMLLYKEHKVNPMAGCLPMLIQMPVFFALFTVLRSAVELRFAPFLWVSDLSEPEGLLADVLPIPLNILPLLMTATTVLQQKMTPSTGDPTQKKMMMMMPIVFLFMLYNMPSALVLYWTTSQGLAILQMQLQKVKEKDSDEPQVLPPEKKTPAEPKAGWEIAKARQRKRAKRKKS